MEWVPNRIKKANRRRFHIWYHVSIFLESIKDEIKTVYDNEWEEKMKKDYTIQELIALQTLIHKYGHLTYVKTSILEKEYYQLTGIYRASGALYMAAWRLEKGYYNHLLTVV